MMIIILLKMKKIMALMKKITIIIIMEILQIQIIVEVLQQIQQEIVELLQKTSDTNKIAIFSILSLASAMVVISFKRR